MQKGFGLFELLIVIFIIVVLYVTMFFGKKSPVDKYIEHSTQVQTQQQLINDKIQEIENLKSNRINIEKNMYEGY
ncbi:MAG: prepilin-type N-terminal cleavage/methylation domain-containing protein [Cyanobacteria bacterium SIG26]|nr:prepilin-type N-terminal cleavage/methylation domain-containing protein [Cyanobacteria bacterium SIG26]